MIFFLRAAREIMADDFLSMYIWCTVHYIAILSVVQFLYTLVYEITQKLLHSLAHVQMCLQGTNQAGYGQGSM